MGVGTEGAMGTEAVGREEVEVEQLGMEDALNVENRDTCPENVTRVVDRVATNVERKDTSAGNVLKVGQISVSTVRRRGTCQENVQSQKLLEVEGVVVVEAVVEIGDVVDEEGLVVVDASNVEKRDTCPENALREVVEEEEETPSVTIAKRWVTCPGSALNLPIEGVEEEGVVAGAVEVTEAGEVT